MQPLHRNRASAAACAVLVGLVIFAGATRAHADTTLGVEWEVNSPVLWFKGKSNKIDWAQVPERMLCTRERAPGDERYPLVSFTYDRQRAPRVRQFEIMTGPIDYRAGDRWELARDRIAYFYRLVRANCESLRFTSMNDASFCVASIDKILQADQASASVLTTNCGTGSDGRRDVVGIGIQQDPAITNEVAEVEGLQTKRAGMWLLDWFQDIFVGTQYIQVNVPVRLSDFGVHDPAEKDFALLYAKPDQPGGAARLAYSKALSDAGIDGDARGFLTLYLTGLAVHAQTVWRSRIGMLDVATGVALDGDEYWVKNAFDLFPKAPLHKLFARLTPDDQIRVRQVLASEAFSTPARLCVMVWSDACAPELVQAFADVHVAWAGAWDGEVLARDPLNFEKLTKPVELEGQPLRVLFEMRVGGGLNAAMNLVGKYEPRYSTDPEQWSSLLPAFLR